MLLLLVPYVLTVTVLFLIGLATSGSTALVAVLFALILMGPLFLVDWTE